VLIHCGCGDYAHAEHHGAGDVYAHHDECVQGCDQSHAEGCDQTHFHRHARHVFRRGAQDYGWLYFRHSWRCFRREACESATGTPYVRRYNALLAVCDVRLDRGCHRCSWCCGDYSHSEGPYVYPEQPIRLFQGFRLPQMSHRVQPHLNYPQYPDCQMFQQSHRYRFDLSQTFFLFQIQ